MKIGMFASMIPQISKTKGMTRRETIEYLVSLGVVSAESDMGELKAYGAESFCTEMKECGLELECLHALVNLTTRDDSELVKQYLSTAASCGCKYFLIVPGYAESVETKKDAADRIIERLIPLSEFALENGIQLTIENFSQVLTPYSTPEELLYILENVPKLKYTYDTGNFSYLSLDVNEAFEKLKDHIAYVHAKDLGDRLTKDNCASEAHWKKVNFYGAPVGGGSVGFDKIIDNLRSVNYNGPLIIEQSISRSDHEFTDIMEGSVKWLISKGIF